MAPEKRTCDASDPCEFIFEFLFDHQLEWFGLWVTVGLIYYILLLLYAIRLKPEADLHSCVVNGRVEQLKALLSVPDVGLDVNRYGPQGRTPLHLAASLAPSPTAMLLTMGSWAHASSIRRRFCMGVSRQHATSP